MLTMLSRRAENALFDYGASSLGLYALPKMKKQVLQKSNVLWGEYVKVVHTECINQQNK